MGLICFALVCNKDAGSPLSINFAKSIDLVELPRRHPQIGELRCAILDVASARGDAQPPATVCHEVVAQRLPEEPRRSSTAHAVWADVEILPSKARANMRTPHMTVLGAAKKIGNFKKMRGHVDEYVVAFVSLLLSPENMLALLKRFQKDPL